MKKISRIIESALVFNCWMGFAVLKSLIWIGEAIAVVVDFILASLFILLGFKAISLLSSDWQFVVIGTILLGGAVFFASVISLYLWKNKRFKKICNKFFSD